MSNIIYVIPWAICDTDSVYIKQVIRDEKHSVSAGDPFEEWRILEVVPDPDGSNSVYAIVDVLDGYGTKNKQKGKPVICLTNSMARMMMLGFTRATGAVKNRIQDILCRLG